MLIEVMSNLFSHTHAHTHTYIYIYIYIHTQGLTLTVSDSKDPILVLLEMGSTPSLSLLLGPL